MASENKSSIFRKKTIERIASPEQLSDYMHVTGTGIWIVLAAVFLLLAGLLVWSCTGTLKTTSEVSVVVEDHVATVIASEGDILEKGMPFVIDSGEYVISSTQEDEYGRTVGYADVDLVDGRYDAEVVTEELRPIDFLLMNREGL